MMKKKVTHILAIVAMVSTLILSTGCEGESKKLEGDWTISSSSFDYTINGKSAYDYMVDDLGYSAEDAQQIVNLYTSFSEAISGTMTFNSDGSYSATSDGETENGTWVLNSDGSKLSLTYDDEGTSVTDVMDVITLTKSELKVSFSETEDDEDWDQDGTNEVSVFTFTLTLTK